jgi:hypothetical protein
MQRAARSYTIQSVFILWAAALTLRLLVDSSNSSSHAASSRGVIETRPKR